MHKKFWIILATSTILSLVLLAFVILHAFSLRKNTDKLDLIETVEQKFLLIQSVYDLCGNEAKVEYLRSPQYKCISEKNIDCRLENYSLEKLKEINLTIEKAINECIKYEQKIDEKN